MNECKWEAISGFHSYQEFEAFKEWIAKQVEDNVAERIEVASPYIGATTFDETWYKHKYSNSIWRLVEPDPPFHGLFEEVEN